MQIYRHFINSCSQESIRPDKYLDEINFLNFLNHIFILSIMVLNAFLSNYQIMAHLLLYQSQNYSYLLKELNFISMNQINCDLMIMLI